MRAHRCRGWPATGPPTAPTHPRSRRMRRPARGRRPAPHRGRRRCPAPGVRRVRADGERHRRRRRIRSGPAPGRRHQPAGPDAAGDRRMRRRCGRARRRPRRPCDLSWQPDAHPGPPHSTPRGAPDAAHCRECTQSAGALVAGGDAGPGRCNTGRMIRAGTGRSRRPGPPTRQNVLVLVGATVTLTACGVPLIPTLGPSDTPTACPRPHRRPPRRTPAVRGPPGADHGARPARHPRRIRLHRRPAHPGAAGTSGRQRRGEFLLGPQRDQRRRRRLHHRGYPRVQLISAVTGQPIGAASGLEPRATPSAVLLQPGRLGVQPAAPHPGRGVRLPARARHRARGDPCGRPPVATPARPARVCHPRPHRRLRRPHHPARAHRRLRDGPTGGLLGDPRAVNSAPGLFAGQRRPRRSEGVTRRPSMKRSTFSSTMMSLGRNGRVR